jgi:glutamate-1-semialdehyde 2,1-aminomutase
MNQKKSKNLLKKAERIIPALSQTFSKAPYSYVQGVYPTYLEKGKGCYVYDVDNNRYIDYVLGLGPVILGYSYPKVDQAIKNQLKNGISFSIPHRLELEVSEKISKFIPGAEMVKFTKTGSDAGTAAIRAARAHTKCDNIAYCGTGGVWHDWFTVMTSRNAGIPKILGKMIKKFHYNDIESLKIIFEKWKGQVGSVYIEPIFFEFPKKNFLQDVKKIAHKHGAVLIFDEVVSGFRFANGGAQELLKIEADMSVWGKGMANGMPLGAVTGKKWIMQQFNDIFYSTSYGGETLSLAAAAAVMDELKNKSVVKHCWKLGEKLTKEFNQISEEEGVDIKMNGLPVRSFIVAKDENGKQSLQIQSLFYQEMIKRGVLFGLGAVLLSFSHSENHINQTLKASRISMKIVKKAIKENNVEKMLEGKVMKRVMTF